MHASLAFHSKKGFQIICYYLYIFIIIHPYLSISFSINIKNGHIHHKMLNLIHYIRMLAPLIPLTMIS